MNNAKEACVRETLELQTFPLQVFAALWCGVPPSDVNTVIAHAVPVGNSNERNKILIKSSDYPCLFPKMQILMNAMASHELIVCDETGEERSDVAWKRTHISGRRGREFLLKYCREHNDELPICFFPDMDRIPKDDEIVKNIKNENEELRKRYSDAEKTASMQEYQIRCLEMQIADLKKSLKEKSEALDQASALIQSVAKEREDAMKELGTRERGSLYLVIAGLLWEVNGRRPGVESNNANIVTVNVEQYGGKISDDTARNHLQKAVDYATKLKS